MASTARVCPSCRITVLSRYNAEPLCAACLRSVRDPGALVPTWMWDSPPMRRALARADLGAFLAILRGAAGLSQMDLAHLVEGWSQSTVSLIENGRRATLYDVRELLRVADAVDMPRQALLPLVFGDPGVTVEEADNADLTGDALADLDRRSFNTMTAGLAAGALAPMIRIPDRADAAHLRYLRAGLARLRNRDHDVGGGAIVRQAARQFSRARRMLDESDYTETIGRQLLAVAAELAIFTGWLAYDAGQQQLARRLYSEAELLTGSIGDGQLSAHVYLNLAMQSTYLARVGTARGMAREALRFTAQAAETARHEPSPRLHALIALRGAAAHAQLRDEIAFRSAIGQARRELDRGAHPFDPPWCGFVDHTEVTGYDADGRIWLGTPARAAALYGEVLADRGLPRRNRAYYQARLAGALLDDGDRTEAIRQGLMVLPELGEQVTSTRTLIELRPVRAAAEQAAAAEFVTRFDAAARSLSVA
ncbi:hypothetical protein GCM10023196_095350 [Actinoallomurus vinaceus]|uniref:HTH cro/C1-type domain-containing protein n=1 Tax=Actinoallomurus vinaceus TaxID=1080074 RepID=A0ABP8US96_9ACTN